MSGHNGAATGGYDVAHIPLSTPPPQSSNKNNSRNSVNGRTSGCGWRTEPVAASLRRRSEGALSTGPSLLKPRDYLGKHAPPPSRSRSGRRAPVSSIDAPLSTAPKSNAKPAAAVKSPTAESGSSLTEIVSLLAAQLEAAEELLKEKDARIAELSVELESHVQGKAQKTSAQKAAQDAVKEMADQNTKLIRAYLDKKREIKQFHRQAHEGKKRDALLELLKEENAELRTANLALRTRLHISAGNSSSGNDTTSANKSSSAKLQKPEVPVASKDTESAGTTPHSAPRRTLTPKTLRIVSLEDDNRRLSSENDTLRNEQEAILQRTVQRDKVEHFKYLGTLAFQKHSYEDALRHYSDAIAASDREDHSLALLYSNRAACHLSLSKHMASIYDSSLAILLDAAYPRNYRRRADAFVAIGDYFSATADLETMKEMGAWPVELQGTVDRLLVLCRNKAAPVNYYKVLGVAPNATEQEIRAAFKSAALNFHPDKAPDGVRRAAAEVVFRLVSEASRVLSDSSSRSEYDKAARAAEQSQRHDESPSTSK